MRIRTDTKTYWRTKIGKRMTVRDLYDDAEMPIEGSGHTYQTGILVQVCGCSQKPLHGKLQLDNGDESHYVDLSTAQLCDVNIQMDLFE